MKRSVSVLTVLLFIAVISASQRVFAQANSPEARVDAFLKPYIDGGFFFGVIVLTRDGKVTYEKAYGPANAEFRIPNQPNTRIGIASITKPMTSVILIRLLEAKKLSLDDKLSKFIPDFPNGDKITIDMLSKHRSGIPHRVMKPEMESLPYTTVEMVENIKKATLAFEPGTQRLYSSAGYTVLARVLEIASGGSYPELLQEYVLTPAAMTDTLNFDSDAVMERRAEDYMYSNNGFINAELKNYSFLVGAGSVFSTARDLSKFSHAIVDGKFGSNVKSSLVTGPAVTADGSTNGHRSYLEIERDKKYGFVVLSNIGSGSFQAITKGIGEIMQGKELSVKPPSIPKIIPDPNKDPVEFLGVYKRTDDGSETTLLRKKGELYAENIKLFPIRPDCFFEYKFFGEVCFQRDSSAKITGIKWKGTGFELAWVKK